MVPLLVQDAISTTLWELRYLNSTEIIETAFDKGKTYSTSGIVEKNCCFWVALGINRNEWKCYVPSQTYVFTHSDKNDVFLHHLFTRWAPRVSIPSFERPFRKSLIGT